MGGEGARVIFLLRIQIKFFFRRVGGGGRAARLSVFLYKDAKSKQEDHSGPVSLP